MSSRKEAIFRGTLELEQLLVPDKCQVAKFAAAGAADAAGHLGELHNYYAVSVATFSSINDSFPVALGSAKSSLAARRRAADELLHTR